MHGAWGPSKCDYEGNPIIQDECRSAFCAGCCRIVEKDDAWTPERGWDWTRGNHFFNFAPVGDWAGRTYWWKHTWEVANSKGHYYIGVLCEFCSTQGAPVKVYATEGLETRWANEFGWQPRPVQPPTPSSSSDDSWVDRWYAANVRD